MEAGETASGFYWINIQKTREATHAATRLVSTKDITVCFFLQRVLLMS